jgi:hypothetical protein
VSHVERASGQSARTVRQSPSSLSLSSASTTYAGVASSVHCKTSNASFSLLPPPSRADDVNSNAILLAYRLTDDEIIRRRPAAAAVAVTGSAVAFQTERLSGQFHGRLAAKNCPSLGVDGRWSVSRSFGRPCLVGRLTLSGTQLTARRPSVRQRQPQSPSQINLAAIARPRLVLRVLRATKAMPIESSAITSLSRRCGRPRALSRTPTRVVRGLSNPRPVVRVRCARCRGRETNPRPASYNSQTALAII